MTNLFLTTVLNKALNHDYDALDYRSLVYEAGCEVYGINNIPEENEIVGVDEMVDFMYQMSKDRMYSRKIAYLYDSFWKDSRPFQNLMIRFTQEALEIR